MKKYKFLVFISALIFLSVNIFAQDMPMGMGKHKGMGKKFRQVEKLKLIEILKMDEETAVRFFVRREKNIDETMKLVEERKNLIDKLADKLKEGRSEYSELTKRILELEKEIFTKRANFIYSLSDLLNEEQIAKLVVFENRFKREIRDYFMRGRGRMK